MSDHIDAFESMFRAAERQPYAYSDVPIHSVVLVTDRARSEAEPLRDEILRFIPRLEGNTVWRIVDGDDYKNVNDLLRQIDADQTDLIVTYRHLQEEALVPQHSLGVYLDVLTQATTIPVLVLPGTAAHPQSLAGKVCTRVMVVTDNIAGDHAIVNYGVRMCGGQPGQATGDMRLCHVEDDAVYERYLTAIGQIAEIETDIAREKIMQRLQKDASDFMQSCIDELKSHDVPLSVDACVDSGHRIGTYRKLISEHRSDLVVANTKDDEQLAMHGLAYALSVELNDVAMMML